MQDDLIEYLVEQKRSGKQTAVQIMCIVVLSLLVATLPYLRSISLGAAVLWGWISYKFIFPTTQIEYEYLYCDKCITVDKILGKEKRKNVGEFSLDRIEMIAPLDSRRWADFKNKNLKTFEYWSLEEREESKPYGIVYGGGMKIVLDLTEEFAKILQNNAPRKVYFD